MIDAQRAMAGNTAIDDYARRLQSRQQAWWKKLLPVQAPYQWNIRRQKLGRTLEIGCGVGRNLATLGRGSVGVDHNELAVRIACDRGFKALTVAEWTMSPLRKHEAFDGILISHVLEHLDADACAWVLGSYLPYLKPGGRVFMICPQEVGYASDPTHVRFIDGAALTALATRLGLQPEPWFSFPFPRSAGKLFIYNEFCLLASKPA
ncbi:class I SAM-dependent methyltransferase [Sphingomonas sp. MMS24-J13]|uniref:class I SAM-dependent methyltransferase n=1 Tax=Sphingomonas sp. MMS24-J13 TaxID=3238686 RepID=UPI00384B3680